MQQFYLNTSNSFGYEICRQTGGRMDSESERFGKDTILTTLKHYLFTRLEKLKGKN